MTSTTVTDVRKALERHAARAAALREIAGDNDFYRHGYIGQVAVLRILIDSLRDIEDGAALEGSWFFAPSYPETESGVG